MAVSDRGQANNLKIRNVYQLYAGRDGNENIMDSVIEYSINDGLTWHHGRSIAAWVRSDPATLSNQRAVVRDFARHDHGNVESVVTRVLFENDPKAIFNQPVS